jgi:dephospho-CoA kinase
VDADALARDAVAPGQPALLQILDAFGPEALRADGSLDRAWLGRRVFADEAARRRLNGIVHPSVIRELQARIDAFRARQGEGPAVLVAEIPLLFEEGLTGLVDKIVLVVAQQTTQVSRLIDDKHLSVEEAWARVRAQLPPEAKRPHADWIIDGDAPLADVEREVFRIWTALLAQ